MKIVHISNTDSGGALELHAAMLENGIDSSMIVAKHDLGYAGEIYKVGFVDKARSVTSNFIATMLFNNLNESRGMYSYPMLGAKLSQHKLVLLADVIYLHFVAHSSFLSLKGIEQLLKLGKPVIFITRDMWPITGGCHYFRDCDNYITSCSICPVFNNRKTIISYPGNQQKQKYSLYNKYNNLFFVGISSWNTDEIRRAKVTSKLTPITIHNCIDTNIFKPLSKVAARTMLNLPLNDILVGFGARDINNPLKGGQFAKEALKIISQKQEIKFKIVTFGRNQGNSRMLENTEQFNLGQLMDRYSMALFYNAVDVYVNPTLAEAFGNTAAESLSCGVPVVGFKVGGLMDIVDHNVNGYLADVDDTKDLVDGILKFIRLSNNLEIVKLCRRKAVDNYSRNVIFNKHMGLLKEITEGMQQEKQL